MLWTLKRLRFYYFFNFSMMVSFVSFKENSKIRLTDSLSWHRNVICTQHALKFKVRTWIIDPLSVQCSFFAFKTIEQLITRLKGETNQKSMNYACGHSRKTKVFGDEIVSLCLQVWIQMKNYISWSILCH